MATHRISILGQNTLPDSSGDVYFDAFANHASNDRWKHLVGVFKQDTGSVNYLYGTFEVPQNYNASGTTKIIVVWTSAATAGDVQWDFNFRSVSGNDSESLDQTSETEQETVADVAPSAAFERLESEMTPTNSNFAAGDTVQWELGRDGPNESSSMADETLLIDLLFEYTD